MHIIALLTDADSANCRIKIRPTVAFLAKKWLNLKTFLYLCTMNYTIEKITTLIGARRIGETDAQIGWLLTDSRSLCFPEETLFFALKSTRNDGHKYIEDLYRRGVRNFVVEAKGIAEYCPEDSMVSMADVNFLIVPSPLAALQRLAERHRDEFNIPIVGITGSNGKTMVK